MKLTIIRGLPGAGKSTFAKNNYHCVILENDMLAYNDGKYCWGPEKTARAILKVKSIAEQILRFGADVVICNTFIKPQYIDGYKELAKKYNADFEVIHCKGNFGNIHNVPVKVLKNMAKNIEPYPNEKIVETKTC